MPVMISRSIARSSALAPRRIRGCVVALIGAASLAWSLACGGVTDPVANFDTVAYTSAVFALNGSPIGAPTAINTPAAAAVRTDIAYNFDIAFDFDAAGRPVVLTQRAVGSPPGSGHQVGLQTLTGAFASVVEAPRDGWTIDSTLTVSVGQVVGVRAGASVCALFLSPYIYSKMVIDSVNVSQRRLWLTLVTDPNCGFRGLAAGRPTH